MQALPIPLIISFFMKICVFWESFLEIFFVFSGSPCLWELLFYFLFGVFSGIFLGGWILALAEVADMFPVFTRRIRLTQGLPLIILFIALGKLTGTLFFYYFGWQ